MHVETLEEKSSLPVEAAEPGRVKISTRIARSMPMLGRAAQGDKLNWSTTIVLIVLHIGAVAALFFFSWSALIVAVVLYMLSINVGIGMCYHRLLTHRGYAVPKWVEYAMTICATLSLEGGPMFWVGTHRVHHQFSDEEGDPHTPNEGGWWAHIGWILCGMSMSAETEMMARYAPDLARDKFHVWISKYHWVTNVVVAVALYAVGGWSWLLWGTAMRIVLGLHGTWLVNSATHLWGSRRFETRDMSRNSLWVALLTGGEGWHNNHHAHPVSARHGLAWYEVDPNFYGIWLLGKLGLAKDIKLAQFDPNDPKPAGVA